MLDAGAAVGGQETDGYIRNLAAQDSGCWMSQFVRRMEADKQYDNPAERLQYRGRQSEEARTSRLALIALVVSVLWSPCFTSVYLRWLSVEQTPETSEGWALLTKDRQRLLR